MRHSRGLGNDVSPRASKKALRKSLPVMLRTKKSKTDVLGSVSPVNDVVVIQQNSTTTNSTSQAHPSRNSRIQQTNWKQFRPELHKKTFFKGATSLTVGMEGSLNLYDDAARELVKHAYRITNQEMPE